ncbi:h-NS histone family protein [Escherichia coli 6-537-08_S1_C2]|nr:h-NS histone family protein [Escherichia coli P0301867.8]END85807.1 h-NS histone family protein [Escherichia coli P0301867.13]ENH01682.1 h-NS histone family protein [Escherichia coli P0301867.7]KEN35568.1 h-NS histone family protein [Escherichia coli 6-537-08_S1_C2]
MRTAKPGRGLVTVKCHLLCGNRLMEIVPWKLSSLKTPINMNKVNKVFM